MLAAILIVAASVGGRVVVAGSTSPVAGADVMLVQVRSGPAMPQPMPGAPLRRTTDDAGRFVFEEIPAGDYLVRASKAGFFEDGPAFTAAARPTTPVAIAGAVDLGDLPLARGGAIAGRVLDSTGEPVAGAQVVAMHRVPRHDPREDTPSWFPAGAMEHTNDLGEFRLFGVPPGECLVAAAPARSPAGATTAATIETTTFAPGTIDPRAAARVTVASGDTVNGIEIRLVGVPAFQVSGIVVDQAGRPIANATVHLMAVDRARMIGGLMGDVPTDRDGRFAIAGIVAGTYHIFASVRMETWSAGAAPPPQQDVVVIDSNVSGVRIVIQAR